MSVLEAFFLEGSPEKLWLLYFSVVSGCENVQVRGGRWRQSILLCGAKDPASLKDAAGQDAAVHLHLKNRTGRDSTSASPSQG